IKKTKKVKEDFIEEIVDEGVADKRLLVVEGEFSQTLRVMAREGNTLSSVLRNAWDNGDLQTLTKNSPAKATNAHISIIANITPDELTRYLTDTDSNNGFANRFLWVSTKRSKFLPRGGNLQDSALAPLIERIKAAVKYATYTEEITRSEETWAIWEQVYPALSGGREELFGALTSRADANVTRISCIFALLDQSDVVEPQHLLAALAVWQYVEDSVKYIFQNKTGDYVADRIYEAIQQKGRLTKTDISNLFERNQKASKINDGLLLLETNRLIKKEMQSTDGRNVECWILSNTGGENPNEN
ncbi:MAG: DUF3987 domain-containing protein, partial [Candidatus Curtissbacteria bacterium]|nr:DUF3987 domain-containing protein [Candidatus Curtissbacteria bacterium]